MTVDRSIEEQQYLRRFFSDIQTAPSEPKDVTLALSFASLDHGQRLEIPGRIYSFPVSLSKEKGFTQAVSLIRRSVDIDGKERKISCLAGAYTNLILFTIYLMLQGVDDLGDQITSIQASGYYQTAYSRRWLSDFWGCRISNRYSLAEVFFTAKMCQICHHFHFDPFGIAETVEFGSQKPIEAGRGSLLLTGLFPFTQMTPLIRYAPGDLVELKAVDCPIDSVGYRFLGRAKESLDLQPELGPGSFIASGEVLEALDPLADVSRVPVEGGFPGHDQTIGVKPKFLLTRNEEGRAVLQIELRYIPHYFPDRVSELNSSVTEALSRFCPWLGPALHDKRITLDFRPPGTLGMTSSK